MSWRYKYIFARFGTLAERARLTDRHFSTTLESVNTIKNYSTIYDLVLSFFTILSFKMLIIKQSQSVLDIYFNIGLFRKFMTEKPFQQIILERI